MCKGVTHAPWRCETRGVIELSKRSIALGAVLAGGAATRLGGTKATLELAGRPLIAYPLEALAQAGVEAVVVAKEDTALPSLDVPVITEPGEPRHPLAGVIAALSHAHPRPVLALPCDAPFISPMLLRVLASASSATAVRTKDRIHPLIALYTPANLSRLEEAVANGESATQALEALEPEWIQAPGKETFNVNTREDLARAEEILRQPRS